MKPRCLFKRSIGWWQNRLVCGNIGPQAWWKLLDPHGAGACALANVTLWNEVLTRRGGFRWGDIAKGPRFFLIYSIILNMIYWYLYIFIVTFDKIRNNSDWNENRSMWSAPRRGHSFGILPKHRTSEVCATFEFRVERNWVREKVRSLKSFYR